MFSSFYRFSNVQADSSLWAAFLVGGGWRPSPQKAGQQWKISRSVNVSSVLQLSYRPSSHLLCKRVLKLKAKLVFVPNLFSFLFLLPTSVNRMLFCCDDFLCHCSLMPFVGHWEMDGVEPKAGLWLPVMDYLPGHSTGQCLSASWRIMTLKAAGGGWLGVIVCLMLSGLKQIIPAWLGSELLTWCLAISHWHPKSNWQICLLSLTAGKSLIFVALNFRDSARGTSQLSHLNLSYLTSSPR